MRENWQVVHGDSFEVALEAAGKGKSKLVVTSPPYNLGKSYDDDQTFAEYREWLRKAVGLCCNLASSDGSVCFQVGNYVENGWIEPLDILAHSMFRKRGLKLRNRIVWHFGHGLHCKKRFSGRYEVVLWYTKSEDYTFHLDRVRVPSKYPGKRAYRGPNIGHLSSNPLGKNPSDVWDIPNVKGNHVEKLDHPAQFPVGLVERLVLALTDEGDLVVDPFCGVGSSGVAAIVHKRRFIGIERDSNYVLQAQDRLTAAANGKSRYRPHNRELYDHRKSKLSRVPHK